MNVLPPRRPWSHWAKRFAIKLLLAVAIAVPLRAAVLAPYRIAGDSVAPELRNGHWAVAYKLASHFHPGDLLIYRDGERDFVARCEAATPATLKVSRNEIGLEIPRDRVVGRIILSTH